MDKLIEAEIDNHERSFDPDNLRDFVDAYLLKIRQTTDPNSSFYGDLGKLNMRNSMFDIFIAGMDTTATTLRFNLQKVFKIISDILFLVGACCT